MGTNYYVKTDVCENCGRGDGNIHLGKSSAGWKFVFNYNGGLYYKTIDEMRLWLSDKAIFDEYDRLVRPDDFWLMVEEKQTKRTHHGTGSQIIALDTYEFIDGYFS